MLTLAAMSDAASLGMESAALLGAVQGLTEFLPVSSSGHLALAEHWLVTRRGIAMPQDILFECLVHVGTLLAVVFHYRRDLVALGRCWLSTAWRRSTRSADPLWHLTLALIVGTVVTAVIGLALEDVVKPIFAMPRVVGAMLLVTAALLTATRWAPPPREGSGGITLAQAVVIGVLQGIAVTPGISRSGATIAVALLLGVGRAEAARFSFLLSIPAILGATLLEMRDLEGTTLTPGAMAAGLVTAALVGYAALVVLVGFVSRGRLAWFAPYCVIVGVAAITLLY